MRYKRPDHKKIGRVSPLKICKKNLINYSVQAVASQIDAHGKLVKLKKSKRGAKGGKTRTSRRKRNLVISEFRSKTEKNTASLNFSNAWSIVDNRDEPNTLLEFALQYSTIIRNPHYFSVPKMPDCIGSLAAAYNTLFQQVVNHSLENSQLGRGTPIRLRMYRGGVG
jgi:hypothetical protein